MSNLDMSGLYHKIVFELKPDEDNYPPVTAESLWGILRAPGIYEIDNTPYYTYGISKGDYVSTIETNGHLTASNIVQQGGHSTLRVFAGNSCSKKSIIDAIQEMGATCSSTEGMSLFSVDIPAECNFWAIDEYLTAISDDENVAYEDACLQHKNIDPPRYIECLSLASISNIKH